MRRIPFAAGAEPCPTAAYAIPWFPAIFVFRLSVDSNGCDDSLLAGASRTSIENAFIVMAVLVKAIPRRMRSIGPHAVRGWQRGTDVDGRDKPVHDERSCRRAPPVVTPCPAPSPA